MAKDESRDFFPFFELPRELRDDIYDEMLVEKTRAATRTSPQLTASGVGATELLVLCRQFCTEYKAREKKKTNLLIRDHPGLIDTDSLKLSPQIRRISRIAVTVYRYVLGGKPHIEWIERLLKDMGTSPTVLIRLVVNCDDHEIEKTQLVPRWTALPNLVGLEVYQQQYTMLLNDDYDDCIQDSDRLLRKWSCKRQIWEQHEAKSG